MIDPRLTIRRIASIVAEDMGTTLVLMKGAGRKSEDVWPRQVAMYLAHHHLGKSLPEIGRFFGNRDHTTVLHAVRAVTEKAKMDEGLAGRLKALGGLIDAAEAALSVEASIPPEPELVPHPAPPVPVAVLTAPLPATDEPAARRVLDAVRGYVQSRKALRDVEHTRLEFGARRQVEAEYALLDRAWHAYAAGRDRS
jgi:hypothetical protein